MKKYTTVKMTSTQKSDWLKEQSRKRSKRQKAIRKKRKTR